jgi:hypothetical protein
LVEGSAIAASDSSNGILNIVCVKYKITDDIRTIHFPSVAGDFFCHHVPITIRAIQGSKALRHPLMSHGLLVLYKPTVSSHTPQAWLLRRLILKA